MIVYVQPGPLPMGETVLRQTLNMLREYYGDFSVRVDEGDDSPATGTARRWASEHSFPLQHHGIPAAIIVPGDPHEHTGQTHQPESDPRDPAPELLSMASDHVNRMARRSPRLPLLQRVSGLFTPRATVIWLGTPRDAELAGAPHPC